MNPLPITPPATSDPRRRRQGPLDNTWRSLHHHCRRCPPSPSLSSTATIVTIMGLVVAWCRLPPPSSSSLSSNAAATLPTTESTPPHPRSPPPPSPSRPLRPLDRPWRHLGPACGVDALRYNAVSAAPARAPFFERRENFASAAVTVIAMPRSPLWRLALDLRFSGRCRQSGDVDGSTLTLMLVLGASGATTMTPELPGNLRRLCSRSLSFFPQGLTGGASAMVRCRVMAVCCGCLLLVVC